MAGNQLGQESVIFGITPVDSASTTAGGSLTVAAGNAGNSTVNAGAGGNLVLAAGASGVTSLHGLIILNPADLPHTDPSVKGALYCPTVSGALSVSGGGSG